MDRPLLIAHRGGSLEVPENTMAAFRHALDVGVRFVELDVQMTRDGELVVIHDDTVDRTTDGSGAVGEFSFAELRRLDAGAWFAGEHTGERIPTLREVLELCAGAGSGVVIEVKHPDIYPGMEEKVVALVEEMWGMGAENIWCISFDHDSIRRLRRLNAELQLGYLFPPQVGDFARPDDVVQAYCPYYGTALQHPDQVAEAHRMGKYVFVYTVDDVEDVRRLAEAGVDGMVTDKPTLMLKALGRDRQSNA